MAEVPKIFFNKIYKIRVDIFAVIISYVIYGLQLSEKDLEYFQYTIRSSVLYIVIKKLYHFIKKMYI
jgi:hypothetical protein